MKYCSSCGKHVPVCYDEGKESCSNCGRIFVFDVYSTEVQFTKNSSGQSQAMGTIVRSVESDRYSRQRLLENAKDDMTNMKNGLRMGENQFIVEEALKYYEIAVDRNFTKGRRTDQVQAACLYIACRENRKPYLLIEFSNYLRINIYVLGATFLQLCKCLSLHEHPICQNLHDPSIFIHKYTASLTGERNKEICDVALNIIASMNHHWMQTGRRPSGLWGAALYISALANGHSCSKNEILKLVHVCGQTLSKRLVEFENTESGSLTIEELNAKAAEFTESAMEHSTSPSKTSNSRELLCQHKGTRSHFSYGLCKDCYACVIGFEGGSDPPAFQRAERQRMRSRSMDKADDGNLSEKDLDCQHVSREEQLQSAELKSDEPAPEQVGDVNRDSDKVNGVDDMSSKELDESDISSAMSDEELNYYIHNEVETRMKTIVWNKVNKEYLEEEAAKEAEKAAIREAWEAKFKDCPDRLEAAKELEALLAEAAAKSKKERRQKRADEARNSVPAKSATEAAHRLLTKKRLSSKINYDVLEKLFDEPGPEGPKDTKKMRTESPSDNDENLGKADKNLGAEDDWEPEDGYREEYNHLYDENMDGAYEEDYNYGYDDGF